MAIRQRSPPSAVQPPDVPSDPGISGALGIYLRSFALWCREGFNAQMRNDDALPGVLLRGYDTLAGENPNVWMLEASGSGTLALAPVALGTGKVGDPVPVGTGDYVPIDGNGFVTSALNIIAPPTDAEAYIGFFDNAGTRHGYVGWTGGARLASDITGGNMTIGDDGYTRFNGEAIFNNTLNANNGVTFGGWGFGGQNIRIDYDYTNWGFPILVNHGYVIGSFSCLPVSFGDATYTSVKAWAINGSVGLVYAWYAPSAAWTWANGASDVRLKSNIETSQKDALAAINALSVVECDLTYPFPDAKPHHWNWAIVADEDLGAKIPSAYIAAEEHTHAIIRELPVIAALVKAVQQLTARVEELEAR